MSQMLKHYGILGMKWGVRRTEAQLARARGKTKSEKEDEASAKKSTDSGGKTSTKKKISEMTDDELRDKIARLNLEKQYKQLFSEMNPVPKKKGEEFIKRVIAKSGENIATQATTYLMGVGTNKLLGMIFDDPKIVNPKKGQKDK